MIRLIIFYYNHIAKTVLLNLKKVDIIRNFL
ncbi:Uncharacterised protein [Chryseobacterium indoltheticum]|uniref:Uncharacterized protein n=1 Tax=Chryseobacterium indoltheticum TaxID=254 RepID=A0A381FRE8_9FLAO|nr:Uncharacterised protein [Chryseobacterium indoltheticum]